MLVHENNRKHSRASHVHDEKGAFFMIFECFLLFSTMQTHAQAFIFWPNYTTLTTFKKTWCILSELFSFPEYNDGKWSKNKWLVVKQIE